MSQEQMSLQGYANDANDFMQSINSSATSSLSTFLDRAKSDPSFANWTEVQRLEELADFYEQEYRDFSRVANDAAERAGRMGDAARAETWQRTADMLNDWAGERATMADDAWIQRTHELTRGNIAKYFGPVGDFIDAGQVITAATVGDWDRVAEKSTGILFGLAGAGIAAMLIPATWPLAAGAIVIAGAGYLAGEFGEWLGDEVYEYLVEGATDFLEWLDPLGIMNDVNDFFNMARNWIQRRDPLTLDLDGDGLETTGIDPNNPILFDHDGDGTANATGWVKPDDGYLVFDRNENGLIDNGTELFGDSTPLLDENGEVVGQAADGFAALAAEDTNNDGIVDANDANWDKLRVWQDLNSDGKTDEGELKTLEELGIAGFHAAKEENTQVLANGNAVADLGSYIRTDGSEGTLGEVTGNMADIDLIDNPFYREFSDTIPLTEQAKTLADMQGSGNVRDLREASSLSSSLANSVEYYSQATTKAEQLARVDDLIEKWAASSNNPTSIEQAEAQGYRLQYLVPGLTPSMLSNSIFASSGSSSSSGSIVYDPNAAQRREELLAEQARVTELVSLNTENASEISWCLVA